MALTREEKLIRAMLDDNPAACGCAVTRKERLLAQTAKKTCENDVLAGGGAGNGKVTPEDTTFYAQVDSKNLVNVADTVATIGTGEFDVSVTDNIYTFTKIADLTKNQNLTVGDTFTVAESGKYTFTVYSDRTDLGSALYVAVYANNTQMGYGFVTQNWQHSAVLDLVAGTEYHYKVCTNYSTVNSKVETGGTVVFWLQLEAGETSTAWENPFVYEIPSIQTNKKNIEELSNMLDWKYPQNPLIEFGGEIMCFQSIACMGDSLTAGNLDYNSGEGGETTIPGTSYPEQLAAMTGKTVHNCGYGGACATNSETAVTEGHSYLDIAEAKGWFGDDYKAQAYVIALGTNDLSYYGAFDGDVSTDINADDYTQNAKTSVGGYAAIIQRILSVQPKAKIFCVTLPRTRNVGTAESIMTATNDKIAAIADLFGAYVIDLWTYGTAASEVSAFKLHYYNGSHLNAMGYALHARRIISYINWIIRNNAEDFRTAAFIGTEYAYSFK